MAKRPNSNPRRLSLSGLPIWANLLGLLACQAIVLLLSRGGLEAIEGPARAQNYRLHDYQPQDQPTQQQCGEACEEMAQTQTLSSVECFEQLIRERQAHPEWAADIDAEIEAKFSQPLAVMVMDMVGFSRTTETAGIIPTLARIYQIRELTVPLVEAHGGRILKLEADNAYAVFPTAEQALVAMQAVLTRLNEDDLHASLGIGYGDLLVVGERDVFGNEMNLASKLGEDIAGDDEILLTEAALAALPSAPANLEPRTAQVSGLTLHVYRVPLPKP